MLPLFHGDGEVAAVQLAQPAYCTGLQVCNHRRIDTPGAYLFEMLQHMMWTELDANTASATVTLVYVDRFRLAPGPGGCPGIRHLIPPFQPVAIRRAPSDARDGCNRSWRVEHTPGCRECQSKLGPPRISTQASALGPQCLPRVTPWPVRPPAPTSPAAVFRLDGAPPHVATCPHSPSVLRLPRLADSGEHVQHAGEGRR